MFAGLVAARNALADIDAVVSCKIGLESGIAPGDYPMIRLVPSRIVPGRPYSQRSAECLIYFGWPVGPSETGGLEAVYESLFTLEAGILEVLKTLSGRYIETVTDEDRLDTFKLFAIRCELQWTQPDPADQLVSEAGNILLTEVSNHLILE